MASPAFVKCKIVGGMITLAFEMYPFSTINELKEKIAEMTRLGMDRLTLKVSHGGGVLENHRTLEHYKYKELAIIHLEVTRLPEDSEFDVLIDCLNNPLSPIRVRETYTVEDLKYEIKELWSLPTDTRMTMILTSCNTPMEDDFHLFDYYISEDTEINVVLQ